MKRMRAFGLMVMLAATGGVQAQLSGPGLTMPALAGQEVTFDLSPSIGLRGWVGGRHGLLASDGLQASSMVLADWRPLASGFRFSGGLAYGPLWSATSMPGLALDRSLGDPWDVNAGVDTRSWLARGNPYLGLGWGLGSARPQGPVPERRSRPDVPAWQSFRLGLPGRHAVDGMCPGPARGRQWRRRGRGAHRPRDVAGRRTPLLS